jgi:hypothetical protein
MLNTSLELILKAAIDKSGLKLSPKLISKSEGEDTFPLIISFSSNDTVYTLHILSETVEELSSTVSYALYNHENELRCIGKTEFFSNMNTFATKPYAHIIPERISCELCQKKISGECSGISNDLCTELF